MVVPNSRFTRGDVRFILLFADEDLTLPVIQTLIFEEESVCSDGSVYLFREIRAHGDEPMFSVKVEHADELLVDRNGLIEKLNSGMD